MFKRICFAAFATLAMQFAALTAQAQDENYVAGEHYDLISPAIRGSSDKIEVTEFFWYGCGHCYNFEPQLAQWKKSLADDVVLKGSPAMWNAPMEIHAKAFYAAQALGVLDTVHIPLFQALNVDRKRLADEDELADLFAAHGVDREDFSKAFNSFGVGSQARQANARARAAKITGTPELMVAGKYRISTRKAGGQANMLKIADFLIEKERAMQVSQAGS
ncbi:thiol:disulfide interchange protein DsbA/DsbL [Congregibacter variabilis]|uniref:Thiol:disulfide interchange protein n=1 Tax=Congregibacter variabilis TaxID=3081200 RepID=A0ABZ0I0D3_9GAMM|nr:thiol:disulfide interchange protein DsbA/DsbL [Congregibacter sp. IMCC43200]